MITNQLPTLVHGADKIHRIEFESINHAIDVAMATGASNGATTKVRDRNSSIVDDCLIEARDKSSSRNKFYNGFTVEKMRQSIGDPPRDLTASVDELRGDIATHADVPIGTRRRVRRGLEQGDELDPIAWVQRNPDGWSIVDIQTITQPVVRLGVNLSVHYSQGAAELKYRGAAAAALADVLTIRGYSVEVIGYSCSDGCSPTEKTVVASIICKRADQPMDIAAMAFVLSEIAFVRMVLYSARIRCLSGKCSGSWGSPREIPKTDERALDIMVPRKIDTRDAAIKFVKNYSEKFNIQK